jgi:lactam utilization protein B
MSSQDVASHAIALIRNGISFGDVHVKVDTLCLHGDHPNAAQNAKSLHEALKKVERD